MVVLFGFVGPAEVMVGMLSDRVGCLAGGSQAEGKISLCKSLEPSRFKTPLYLNKILKSRMA